MDQLVSNLLSSERADYRTTYADMPTISSPSRPVMVAFFTRWRGPARRAASSISGPRWVSQRSILLPRCTTMPAGFDRQRDAVDPGRSGTCESRSGRSRPSGRPPRGRCPRNAQGCWRPYRPDARRRCLLSLFAGTQVGRAPAGAGCPDPGQNPFEPEYRDYIRDPGSDFISLALPDEGRGNECNDKMT